MAKQIIIEFPDEAARKNVVDALCADGKYAAEIPDPRDPKKKIPNPVTPEVFAVGYCLAWAVGIAVELEKKRLVLDHRTKDAAELEKLRKKLTGG